MLCKKCKQNVLDEDFNYRKNTCKSCYRAMCRTWKINSMTTTLIGWALDSLLKPLCIYCGSTYVVNQTRNWKCGDCHKTWVKEGRRKENWRIKEEEKDEILKLWNAGNLTKPEIAKKVDRSYSSVRGILDIFKNRGCYVRKAWSKKDFFIAKGYKYVALRTLNAEDKQLAEEMLRDITNNSSRKYSIQEHRLVMAKKLGRPLKPHPEEIVHHLNGIKADNRPENLILSTLGTHDTLIKAKAYQKRIKELEDIIAQLKENGKT